ncbi:response regulator receiver domain-containing protein [Paraburkholderia sp. RAU2J]|uniref:response regulator n=1 Tax=Paraburkholderia sp. RAU2J TaxID=1938810 RepID=UPI000F193086|nr:response regulator [Paraburkholderia sp. RAU2J]RKT14099.1 response regulator receiver domain-containing protein [Paraburkholderia sp. RAU2J]
MHQPLRILVVDDHELGAQAVALAMTFAGYEAQFAFSGEDALRRLVSWTPDIAILDVNMPPPNGFQLAATLRGRRDTEGIYLIAHTSMEESEVQNQGVQAGFDAFCRKGAGADPLMAIISDVQAPN